MACQKRFRHVPLGSVEKSAAGVVALSMWAYVQGGPGLRYVA